MKSIIGGCFGVVLIWRIMKIYHIIKRFWLLQWYYSLEDQEDTKSIKRWTLAVVMVLKSGYSLEDLA